MRPRTAVALASLCLFVSSCGAPAPTAGPQRTVPPEVSATTSTADAVTLAWGQVGEARSGVTVEVSQPREVEPVQTLVAESMVMVGRGIACDVVVHNESTGSVRIGVYARSGVVDLPPVDWERYPPLAPGSTASIHRGLLAPRGAKTVLVQVSATVDGLPVPVGWLYAGEIGGTS